MVNFSDKNYHFKAIKVNIFELGEERTNWDDDTSQEVINKKALLNIMQANEGNGAYLYYPNMKDLSSMFSILRELELKLCVHADKLDDGYEFEDKTTLKMT